MTERIAPTTPSRALAAADVVCAVAAVIAAAAHIPVTGPHLAEAPYVGGLFIALEVALLILVPLLLTDGRDRWRVLLAAVSAAALVAYVLTRSFAFPQISDDVGNWLEPLGVVSITSEAVALIAALIGLQHRPGTDLTPAGDAIGPEG